MDYKSLERFIRKEMRMTHIYQPVMIRTLLESKDCRATKESIARQFLGADESQINYYKYITGRWPHQVLKKHGIIGYSRKGEEYTLLLDEGGATAGQKQRLIELCNLRLQEFIDKDPAIRRMRELDSRSRLGSIEFDVRAKSKGVCVACGARAMEVRMHVDHIVPISRGGKNEIDNLQMLCYRCNTQKRDRDETDFLLWHKRLQFRKAGCGMCRDTRHALENKLAYCVLAGDDRLSEVVPKRHVESFISMIPAERAMCMALVDRAMDRLKERYGSKTRFDVMFDVPARGDHYSIRLAPLARR